MRDDDRILDSAYEYDTKNDEVAEHDSDCLANVKVLDDTSLLNGLQSGRSI